MCVSVTENDCMHFGGNTLYRKHEHTWNVRKEEKKKNTDTAVELSNTSKEIAHTYETFKTANPSYFTNRDFTGAS